MGITRCSIFVRGICIKREDLINYGIENLHDDKWEPYASGKEFIAINFSSIGIGDVYIGFCAYDPFHWRGENVEKIEFEIPTKLKVYKEIKKIGIECDLEDVKDMLVGILM